MKRTISTDAFGRLVTLILLIIGLAICLLVSVEWLDSPEKLVDQWFVLPLMFGLCLVPVAQYSRPPSKRTLASFLGYAFLAFIPLLNLFVVFHAGKGLARAFDKKRAILLGIAAFVLLFMLADFLAYRARMNPAPGAASATTQLRSSTGLDPVRCTGMEIDQWLQAATQRLDAADADLASITDETNSTTYYSLRPKAANRRTTQQAAGTPAACVQNLQNMILDYFEAEENLYYYGMLDQTNNMSYFSEEAARLRIEIADGFADLTGSGTASASTGNSTCSGSDVTAWIDSTQKRIDQAVENERIGRTTANSTTILTLGARASEYYEAQKKYPAVPPCLAGLQATALSYLNAEVNVFQFSLVKDIGGTTTYRDEAEKYLAKFSDGVTDLQAKADSPSARSEASTPAAAAFLSQPLSGFDLAFVITLLVGFAAVLAGGYLALIGRGGPAPVPVTPVPAAPRASRPATPVSRPVAPNAPRPIQHPPTSQPYPPAPKRAEPPKTAAAPAVPAADSAGGFPRHKGSCACEVCTKSLSAGEGYDIPPDSFYGSTTYQDWLAKSELGQMIIPAAGGMDAYLQKARARRGASPAVVCADCLHFFPQAVSAPEPAKPAAPTTRASASAGGFPRHSGSCACEVCTKSVAAGEGYEIPPDTFYGSKPYQDWLARSELGQMIIPAAGGMDSYLQKARARRGASPAIVCADCLRFFPQAESAPAADKPAAGGSSAAKKPATRKKPTAPESGAVSGSSAEKKPATRKKAAAAEPVAAGAAPRVYKRAREGGMCDVCASEVHAGEGYRIPVDDFYASEKYRKWLLESPLGQMAVPMAGGIEAYIRKAREMDQTTHSVVCGDCVHLFK